MWDEQRIRDLGVLEKYRQTVENMFRARLEAVKRMNRRRGRILEATGRTKAFE